MWINTTILDKIRSGEYNKIYEFGPEDNDKYYVLFETIDSSMIPWCIVKHTYEYNDDNNYTKSGLELVYQNEDNLCIDYWHDCNEWSDDDYAVPVEDIDDDVILYFSMLNSPYINGIIETLNLLRKVKV